MTNRNTPWAVVTGASDGIGRAIALELAREGTHVVLSARRQVKLDVLADEIRALGVEARVVPLDFSHPEASDRLLQACADLDVGLLVASAGFGSGGAFLDADLSAELDMVDVNCRAVVALAHGFGARFVARGRGGIVLMSSLLAFQGVPRAATYAASKAFVQSFAEGLRSELAPHGVDVLASAPGPVHSGFAGRAGMQMSLALTPEDVAPATLRALGRTGTVRPGWLSKLLEASLALLPRTARSWISSLVMRGMTPTKAATVSG